MLKPQEVIIEVGRAVGGDFIKVTHTPTGIFRIQGPPLHKPGKARYDMLRQIEAELVQRGLTQHVLSETITPA